MIILLNCVGTVRINSLHLPKLRVQVPEISGRQVWNYLQHLEETATGPYLILFWVWRDHAEIFTSLIRKIWNISLRFSTWPSSWKRAHVTPPPPQGWRSQGKDRLRRNQHHPCNCTRIWEVRACITFTRGTLLSNIWAQLSLPTGRGELYRRAPKYAAHSLLLSRWP